MGKFIRSDGNGGSVISAKPHEIISSVIVTLVIFIAGIIYAAGIKSLEVTENKKDIAKIEVRLEKIENALSDITEIKTDVRWIKDYVIKNK